MPSAMPNSTIEMIHARRSIGVLTEPAPSDAEVTTAIQAAIAAPDHRQLTPWRFYSISGEEMQGFSQVLVDTAKDQGINDPERLARVAKHPERAPLIIVCVTNVVEHLKVPTFEQLLSTGAAVQNMLLAFEAMGYGTMWRSGDAVLSDVFKQHFDAGQDDYISGIIYVGSKAKTPKDKPPRDITDFHRKWSYTGG